MTFPKSLSFLLIFILLTGCKQSQEQVTSAPLDSCAIYNDSLAKRIDDYITRKGIDDNIAFCLYDLTADSLVYGFHPHALMPPASCMKLLTGIAALHSLKEDYTFDTQLFIKGKIENGVLKGDLILYGGFDPLFTTEDLGNLFASLPGKGIRRIQGNVILTLDVTESPSYEDHWIPGDLKRRHLGFFYRAPGRMKRDLAYLLSMQGIAFSPGAVRYGAFPLGAKPIAIKQRPLTEILTVMWKNSHNEVAETLLYPLGHAYRHTGDLRQNGKKHLARFLSSDLKLDAKGYRLHDGCGLCIHNRLSPTLLVTLLRDTYHQPYYPFVKEALPHSGIDGTLIGRMRNGITRNKIFAKTGTLTREDGVSCLSGYFTGNTGHDYCFAIMLQRLPVFNAQAMQDNLCTLFFKPKP